MTHVLHGDDGSSLRITPSLSHNEEGYDITLEDGKHAFKSNVWIDTEEAVGIASYFVPEAEVGEAEDPFGHLLQSIFKEANDSVDLNRVLWHLADALDEPQDAHGGFTGVVDEMLGKAVLAIRLSKGAPTVVQDVLAERDRQINLGYTPEHDDIEGLYHLLNIADDYLPIQRQITPELRGRLVKSAATLVATIQHIDRQTAADEEAARLDAASKTL